MTVESGHILKSLQSQIIKGYTKIHSPLLNSDLYLRHLDNFISSDVDFVYQKFLKKALDSGLKSNKESLEYLIKEKLWSESDEKKLTEQKDFLERLKITKSRKILKAEIRSIRFQMEAVEKEIGETQNKKSELLGLTAEIYATKKINSHFIYLSLYKDSKLEDLFYSEEEFEELEDDHLRELVLLFNDYSIGFSSKNLKKIALQPSYLNYFYLCSDNPYIFYGKPVCNLTFYQAEVFSHAKYFKQILSEMKAPLGEEFMNDPDKLVEWFESNKNAENLMKKHENSDDMNMSIVGATSKDLEDLGLKHSGKTINLAQEAAKKGGVLGMNDLLRLQGL